VSPRRLALGQFGGKGRAASCRTAADRLALCFLDHLRLGIALARVMALFSGRLPRCSNDFTSHVETGPRLAFESQGFHPQGVFLDQCGSCVDCVRHWRLVCGGTVLARGNSGNFRCAQLPLSLILNATTESIPELYAILITRAILCVCSVLHTFKNRFGVTNLQSPIEKTATSVQRRSRSLRGKAMSDTEQRGDREPWPEVREADEGARQRACASHDRKLAQATS